MTKKLIRSVPQLLQSYKNNFNTGSQYEISAATQILINNGFGINTNKYNKNLVKFDGMIGLFNISQKDDLGGTGDIAIVFKDKPTQYYSITKTNKKLEKCISNPSSKLYNINKENYQELSEKTYLQALNWIKINKGHKPNKKWKKCRNPYAKMMCERLAYDASKNWNQMDPGKKLKNVKKILDINPYFKINTNGIIYSSEKGIENIYNWNLPQNLNLSDYLITRSDGIYIYHYLSKTNWKNSWFLKTQVKYNNGIIEGLSLKIPENQWIPRIGDPFGSWNCNVRLDKIFQVTRY